VAGAAPAARRVGSDRHFDGPLRLFAVTRDREGTCCSLDDLYDARRVCDTLGIPYYVLNLRDEFRREVIDPFVREYQAAARRTRASCATST